MSLKSDLKLLLKKISRCYDADELNSYAKEINRLGVKIRNVENAGDIQSLTEMQVKILKEFKERFEVVSKYTHGEKAAISMSQPQFIAYANAIDALKSTIDEFASLNDSVPLNPQQIKWIENGKTCISCFGGAEIERLRGLDSRAGSWMIRDYMLFTTEAQKVNDELMKLTPAAHDDMVNAFFGFEYFEQTALTAIERLPEYTWNEFPISRMKELQDNLVTLRGYYNEYSQTKGISKVNLNEFITTKKGLENILLEAGVKEALFHKVRVIKELHMSYESLRDEEKGNYFGLRLREDLQIFNDNFFNHFGDKINDINWDTLSVENYEEYIKNNYQDGKDPLITTFKRHYQQLIEFRALIDECYDILNFMWEYAKTYRLPSFVSFLIPEANLKNSIARYQNPQNDYDFEREKKEFINNLNRLTDEYTHLNYFIEAENKIKEYEEKLNALPILTDITKAKKTVELQADPKEEESMFNSFIGFFSRTKIAEEPVNLEESNNLIENRALLSFSRSYCFKINTEFKMKIRELKELHSNLLSGSITYHTYNQYMSIGLEHCEKLDVYCVAHYAHYKFVQSVNNLLLRLDMEHVELDTKLQQYINVINCYFDGKEVENIYQLNNYNVLPLTIEEGMEYPTFDMAFAEIKEILALRKEQIEIKEKEQLDKTITSIGKIEKKIKQCARNDAYKDKGLEMAEAQEIKDKMQKNLDDYLNLAISRFEFYQTRRELGLKAVGNIVCNEHTSSFYTFGLTKTAALIQEICDYKFNQ